MEHHYFCYILFLNSQWILFCWLIEIVQGIKPGFQGMMTVVLANLNDSYNVGYSLLLITRNTQWFQSVVTASCVGTSENPMVPVSKIHQVNHQYLNHVNLRLLDNLQVCEHITQLALSFYKYSVTFAPSSMRSDSLWPRGLFQLEKSLSPIDWNWLYVINLSFFVWRHECHRFLLSFWLKQIILA